MSVGSFCVTHKTANIGLAYNTIYNIAIQYSGLDDKVLNKEVSRNL